MAQLVAGLVFGLGLVVSGMSDPAKVLNFLDIAGTWDPSLIFVMGGAVAVTAIGYRLVLARGRPVFDTAFHVPTSRLIDRRVILGPALFGMGWGLSGFCPGPAIVSVPLGSVGALVFGAMMLAGMAVAKRLILRKS